MYALHALKFARRFRRYNRPFKPLFDRFAESVGLGRLGDVAVFDVPRRLGHLGIGAASAGMALVGMKRQRMSYAARSRAGKRIGKRRKIAPMPRQAMPYRMAAQAAIRKNVRRRVTGKRSYAYKRTRLTRVAKPRPAMNIPMLLDRLQGVKLENPTEDPGDTNYEFPGYYPIGKGDPAPVGACAAPVYFFNLTGYQQGDIATRQMGYRMFITDTGVPSFNDPGCQLETGLTTGVCRYIREDRRHEPLSTALYPSMQHMWYDIRLKLYGCRKQAVTYDIMLLRFKRDGMDPIGNPTVGTTAERVRTTFYQGLSKRLVTNSILPGNNSWTREVQIVRRRRIRLNAEDSGDNEVRPHSIDLKWFVRDGRLLSFRDQAAPAGTDTTWAGAGWTQTNQVAASGISYDPRDRSRLWLCVCATDMILPAVGEDQDDTPSFDICLRRKSLGYL